jgi:pyrroline-5-carboxylate reductase
MNDSIGFIGAGRITYILLERLRRTKTLPTSIVVSDPDPQAVEILRSQIPDIEVLESNNSQVVSQDIVFLGVHPPSVTDVLEEIKHHLRPESLLVSLAPKFKIKVISQNLGGFNRIVRMIPNAPSIVGSGFNPIAFSPSIQAEERKKLLSLFLIWGNSPEVPEADLELYVILTAVGPTYYWFQWIELYHLMQNFGLAPGDIEVGLSEMIRGSIKALFKSGLHLGEVTDLVKIKPFIESEDEICDVYRTRLTELYHKLVSTP